MKATPPAARPTLAALAADLAAGRTTSRKLVADCLCRISHPDGEGKRVFVKVYDVAARIAAEAQDRLRAAGYIASPLAGIPVSIKDLFEGARRCAAGVGGCRMVKISERVTLLVVASLVRTSRSCQYRGNCQCQTILLSADRPPFQHTADRATRAGHWQVCIQADSDVCSVAGWWIRAMQDLHHYGLR